MTTKQNSAIEAAQNLAIEAAQSKLFDTIHDARHEYVKSMGDVLSQDGKISLQDMYKIAVSAHGITDTVHISNVMQDCERIGKTIDDESRGDNLLVSIIGASMDAMIKDTVPEMLGHRLASKVMAQLLTEVLERKDPTSNTSFSEIITDMKRH